MLPIAFLLISTFFLNCKKETEELPYYNSSDFSPIFKENINNVNKEISHKISDFAFTNQNGKIITQKDIEGKIHVANFIFTRCGSICPVMTTHMKLIQSEFGNNSKVVMLSFSVTPWIDSVARLKEYALKNQITASNWHLLTGKKSDIYTLARKSYFAEEELGFTKDSTDFLHTEHILLIDRNKRIRGVYNGTLELEAMQLIEDIKTLIK